MLHFRRILPVLMLVSGCAYADETSTAPHDPARQFDFWSGDWSVENQHLNSDGTWRHGGTANVTICDVLGGRAIVERWTGRESLALRGFSLRTYDREQKRWEIVLNWHSGSPGTFSYMVGNFSAGKGEFFPPTQPARTRFSFTDIADRSCRWEQATSSDGATWVTDWTMQFDRTGPARSLNSANLSIATIPASVADTYPGSRQLDHLIGIWHGQATRTSADGKVESGTATRRISPVVDGFALLELTTFSWGAQSISVLAHNPKTGVWRETGMSDQESDCHWLQGYLSEGHLRLNEQPNSNNGVRHTWNDISVDAHSWSRSYVPTNSNKFTASDITVSFFRTEASGRIDKIPNYLPSPDVQVAHSQSLVNLGQYVEAESLLRDVVDRPNAPIQASFLLGYVLQSRQEFDEATACYEVVRESANPSLMPTIEYNLACICSIRGDADAAIQHLEAARIAGFNNMKQLRVDPDFELLRSDPRFVKLAGPDNGDFLEPNRVIHELKGENAGDQFGWTARRAGDWDKDGAEDFVATAPTYKGTGKVYVYSGRSGKLLMQKQGKAGEQFGNSATGAGDVNKDGHADLIVGAPNSKAPGNAYVYSGKDGTILHHFTGVSAGDKFGYEVSGLGDIDRDGHADLLVGAAAGKGRQPGAGAVFVYSGKSGAELMRLPGDESGDSFGNAAGYVLNADGSTTLAVGAKNAGPGNRGRVYVYRIVDGETKSAFNIDGDGNSRNLGQMFIAFPGDQDGDGFGDIYASDFNDNTSAKGGGKVMIVSGKDGTKLLELTGKQPGEGLGTSPGDAGDVNGDGAGDLVIGAWQNGQGAKSGGKVYLHDGRTGALIRAWTCTTAGDTFGFDACGIGDVDGDGEIDFLLTSAWSANKTGRVFVIAGEKSD